MDMRSIAKRLSEARAFILDTRPFFGRLLMNLSLGFAECGTAYTDMKSIVFDPLFAEKLTDEALRFVYLHELMHCVLKHCTRGAGKIQKIYNIACDIVVNSVILEAMGKEEIIVCGLPAMHRAPNGREGREYTAEEVYKMLMDNAAKLPNNSESEDAFSDNHDVWATLGADSFAEEEWNKHITDAAKAAGNETGIPHGIERLIRETERSSKINWRQVLRDFIQFEKDDYTYDIPDRRFSGDIVMPSFQNNICGEHIDKIWFLADASGSVSDKALAMAFNEIRDAAEQIESVEGLLSFFDTRVSEPMPFESVEDFGNVTVNGGGTSFKAIFRCMKKYFTDELPRAVIIITDGYAAFPSEAEMLGTQVIWIIADSEAEPPHGECIHIYS